MSDSYLSRAAAEFTKHAKENVTVEFVKGTFFVWGSELATLRLFKAYSKNGRQNYSVNMGQFYFSLETAF